MKSIKQQFEKALKRAFIGKYFKMESTCMRDNHVFNKVAFVVDIIKFEEIYMTLQEKSPSHVSISLSYSQAIALADKGTLIEDYLSVCQQERYTYTLTKEKIL